MRSMLRVTCCLMAILALFGSLLAMQDTIARQRILRDDEMSGIIGGACYTRCFEKADCAGSNVTCNSVGCATLIPEATCNTPFQRVVDYKGGNTCEHVSLNSPDGCDPNIPTIVCRYLQPCYCTITSGGSGSAGWECLNNGSPLPTGYVRVPC